VTTARGLLRRLLRHGRIDPRVPSTVPDEPAAEQRLEAARQRLKQTIPPPEDGGAEEAGARDGEAGPEEDAAGP
jgi:hypothetical protein